jgi:hypothetical protein
MKETKDLIKELKDIESELRSIWNQLSNSEKQKRIILHKMNRVQMTLHRLMHSHDGGAKTQDPSEPKVDASASHPTKSMRD